MLLGSIITKNILFKLYLWLLATVFSQNKNLLESGSNLHFRIGYEKLIEINHQESRYSVNS